MAAFHIASNGPIIDLHVMHEGIFLVLLIAKVDVLSPKLQVLNARVNICNHYPHGVLKEGHAPP